MNSVLQDWVNNLPLMQQSVLISALRGADGLPKNNPGKSVVRCLRKVVCVDAKPEQKHSYMSVQEDSLVYYINLFLEDIDIYPLHFFFHLLYAIEIIAYKHPVIAIRDNYKFVYLGIVKAIHLNIESEEELNKRLNK